MGDWDFVCALCAAPFSAASFEDEPEHEEDKDGVDRSLLPEAAIKWLERLRAVAENEAAVGVGRCYISGPGKAEMYGSLCVTPGDHPNAPASQDGDIDLSAYYNYAEDFMGAIPLHFNCLAILKKVLERDGYDLNADTLYASFLEAHDEGLCCMRYDYYDFHGLTGQYFDLEAGHEAFVCDPIDIHQLKEYLDHLPTIETSDSSPSSEVTPFVSSDQDPFAVLPPELINTILLLIPRQSFIPFLLASPAARRIQLTRSFFLSRMATDMPWLWELLSPSASREFNPLLKSTDIDWRAVYTHLRIESGASRTNAIPGLANRRRIWDICNNQAAKTYERIADEERKAEVQVQVPKEVRQRVVCTHVPHVLSPVPTKAVGLTVWLPLALGGPVATTAMGKEKKVKLYWTAKGVLSSIAFEFDSGAGEEKVLFGPGQGVRADECVIEAGDWIDGFEFSIGSYGPKEGGSGDKEDGASDDEDGEDEDNEEEEDDVDEDDEGREMDDSEVEDDASDNEDDASNDEDDASDKEGSANDDSENGSASDTENSDDDNEGSDDADEDDGSDKQDCGLAIKGVIIRRLDAEPVAFGDMRGHRRLTVVQEGHTLVGLRGEAFGGMISRVGLLELPELLGPQRRPAPDASVCKLMWTKEVPNAPLACHPSEFGYWSVQEASDLVPFYPLYFGRTDDEFAALTGIAVGNDSLGIAVYHDGKVSGSAGKLEEGFMKYFPVDGKGGERVIGFTVTMGALVDGFKIVTNRGRQAIFGRTEMTAGSFTSTTANPCVLAGLYCSYGYKSGDDHLLSSVSVLKGPGSSEAADFNHFVRDQCIWEPSPPPATWHTSTPAFGAFADDNHTVFLDLSKPVKEIKGLLAAPDWVDVVELGGFVVRYADGTVVYVGLPSIIWSQLDDDKPMEELPRHQHMSTSLGPMNPPELPAHVKDDEEVRAQNRDGAVWRLGDEGERIAKVVVWETGSGRIDGMQFYSETGKASLRWGKCGDQPTGEITASDRVKGICFVLDTDRGPYHTHDPIPMGVRALVEPQA